MGSGVYHALGPPAQKEAEQILMFDGVQGVFRLLRLIQPVFRLLDRVKPIERLVSVS